MAMTMLEKKKSGGPYPKEERVKRQNEVSRLYFEYGYSATKISEIMNVNRNTINQDIKNTYSEIKDELKESSENLILKQIGRLEEQRYRITKNLNEIKNKNYDALENAIRYEKLLLDIDSKINVILAKINSDKIEKTAGCKISQGQIKDFVLFLLIKYSKNKIIKEEQILCEILNIYQCGVKESVEIISHIKELGIDCCKKMDGDYYGYDLIEFAFMRRYILPNDRFVTNIQSLYILHIHSDSEKSLIKKRFNEKYGSQEKWNDEIFEEYNKEQIKNEEKIAESYSSIISEALGNLSDQKEIKKYLHCINTFFEKDKSQIGKLFDA